MINPSKPNMACGHISMFSYINDLLTQHFAWPRGSLVSRGLHCTWFSLSVWLLLNVFFVRFSFKPVFKISCESINFGEAVFFVDFKLFHRDYLVHYRYPPISDLVFI